MLDFLTTPYMVRTRKVDNILFVLKNKNKNRHHIISSVSLPRLKKKFMY
jgi:hypothetical protein